MDEAEAFGDIELMAEFSLLSVVQNLQQGKMGPDLLETLEVEQIKFKSFYINGNNSCLTVGKENDFALHFFFI